jgi:hypothetical protein
MKIVFTLLFIFCPVIIRGETLDKFLSTTLLGQRAEEIEQSFNLNPGKLKDIPAYVEIGEFDYGGIIFKVNVFCRNGVCKAYGVWKSQIRNKDKNGQLKHEDNAEIHDVFKALLSKLSATYGQAPRVKFKVRCCGCESGPLSQSYTWVNEKYALVFMFHDNGSTQSITLRQYLRDEKNGEFRGEDELSFFENLYKNQSGKLPDEWPGSEAIPAKITENPILDNQPHKQLDIDRYREELIERNAAKDKREGEKHVLLRPYSIVLYIFILAVLCIWTKKRMPK